MFGRGTANSTVGIIVRHINKNITSFTTATSQFSSIYVQTDFLRAYVQVLPNVYISESMIKLKVPLEIAAANKQQSMLMRSKYKLSLLDHSFACCKQAQIECICNKQHVIYEANRMMEASGW